MRDLGKLLKVYEHEEFTFQNAIDLLNHDRGYTGAILASLGESGYIAKRKDPSDGRKRYYRVKNVDFDDIIKNIEHEAVPEK